MSGQTYRVSVEILVEKAKQGVSQLKAAFVELEKGANSAGKEVDDFGDKTEKTSKKTKGLKDALEAVGKAAAVGLGVMAVGINAAVNAAVDFEKSMAGVKKVIDFETPEQFKQMEQDIIALSQRLPMAATDIAAIMEAAGQSGIARDELARFAESAVKMGVAFDITADQAGKAMAEMRASFGMTQTEVETLADQINYLGNNSTNSAPHIMEVVQRIGSLAEMANISSSTLAALSASMVGIAPEVAATSLKNFALQLVKGESLSKSAKAAFVEMGLDYNQIAKDMQTDSEATIRKVLEAAQKVPEHMRAAVLNDAFGSESIAAISQLVTNYETVDKNLKAMGDSAAYAGSMLKEFEGMAGTSAAQMQLFDNNIQAMKIAFGSAFLPVLNQMMESLTPILQKITEWAQQNPELVQTITAITGAVLGVVAVLGGLALAFTAVTGGIAAITAIATTIAGVVGAVSSAVSIVGMFGGALAALGFPVTAVVAGITALVAGGVALYQNWDSIKAKGQEVWNNVKQYVTDAWKGVQDAWNGVGAWFDGIWQDVKTSATKQWDDIKNSISNKADEIKTTATAKFNEIKEAASRAFNGLPEPVRSALTAIVGVVRGQFEFIKNIFTTAFNVIKALVRGDMEGVKNAISSGLQNAASIARTMVTNIVGVFKNLGAQLLQAGRDAVQGFINGLTSKMGEALAKAREMASKVISTVKSALDIHSPSREMKKLGKHTADGMAVGIEQNTPKAVKAAQKMADDIKKTVADSVANLKREIALFGNDSPIDALKYDISIGKYKGADTKELEALTAQKYALERNKVVLDEIDGIKEKIALVGKNELETLKYQLEHADKYKGISDDIKKSYLERTEALNQAIKAQERLSKVEAATADIAKNKHILANWQDKHAGLKYDLGKDGYDASQIEQIVQAEVVKEQVGKLQQLFSDISNKQVFATPKITANLANNGGGFDFAGQMLGQSFDIVKKFEEQNALLKAAREQGLIEEEVYLKQSEALTQAHVEAKAALMQTATQSVLGGITGIMKNVYGEQSKHYKAAFAMEKAYAVATILMKQKEAIAKAWASAPFPANLGAVAKTLAQTGALASAVNAIKPIGQAHDGIMSVPKSGTWNLEKGERVLPRHTAQNLDNTLNRLQGRGETKVIINNYTGEKTDMKQMPNGDVLVTIGKMIDDKVDAKVNQRFIQARRQGGELYGR